MMVNVFDDKRSFFHFILGAVAVKYPYIFIIFLFYEIIEKLYEKDEKIKNFFGDLFEFAFGTLFGVIFAYTVPLSHQGRTLLQTLRITLPF